MYALLPFSAVAQRCTLRVSVAVFVTPPPVAVIVNGYVPVFVLRATVMLKSVVPEPGAAIDAGEKLNVIPDGAPLAVNVIAESTSDESAEGTASNMANHIMHLIATG